MAPTVITCPEPTLRGICLVRLANLARQQSPHESLNVGYAIIYLKKAQATLEVIDLMSYYELLLLYRYSINLKG